MKKTKYFFYKIDIPDIHLVHMVLLKTSLFISYVHSFLKVINTFEIKQTGFDIAYLFQIKTYVNWYWYFTAANCLDGYHGKYCEKQCSFPKFGFGCQQRCLCTRSKCHFSTGCHFEQNGKIFFNGMII